MKKIMYLIAISIFSCCFIGTVSADYSQGSWSKVSCCNTTDPECTFITDVLFLNESGYTSYSLNPTTGLYTGSGSLYSTLSSEAQNEGTYFIANDNELKAYLINVDNTVFNQYNITDAGDNNFCIAKQNSKESYSITSEATTNGSFTVKVNGDIVSSAEVGQTVTIDTLANDDYDVKDVKVYKTGTEEIVSLLNNQFVMPNYAVTIIVEFEKVVFDITTEETENGSYTVTYNDEEATRGLAGSTIMINTTPAIHYDLDAIKIINLDTEEDITSEYLNGNELTMPKANIKIEVTFKLHQYTIGKMIISGDHGTHTTTLNGNVVTTAGYNQKVVVNPVPEEGYEVENIQIYDTDTRLIKDVTKEDGIWSFDMLGENIKIHVTYKETTYNISKVTSEYGSFNISAEAAPYGSWIVISDIESKVLGYTAYINNKYNVKIKNHNTGDEITNIEFKLSNKQFKMPACDIDVEVVFTHTENPATVSSVAGGGSTTLTTVDGESKWSYYYGDTVKLNFHPYDGYALKAVKIVKYNSKSEIAAVYNKASETFIMPGERVEVQVTYKKISAAPKTISAKLYGTTGYDDVRFTWSQVSNTDGYIVYYKKSTSSYWTKFTDTDSAKAGTKPKIYYSGTTRYINANNLTDGAKYIFRIQSYIKDINGNRKYSNEKTWSIYTLKKMAAPKITRLSSKSMRVSYTKINGASGYVISQSTKKTGTNTVSKITVKRNKTYYYKVRAYKIGLNGKRVYGPWSNVKAYTLR